MLNEEVGEVFEGHADETGGAAHRDAALIDGLRQHLQERPRNEGRQHGVGGAVAIAQGPFILEGGFASCSWMTVLYSTTAGAEFRQLLGSEI